MPYKDKLLQRKYQREWIKQRRETYLKDKKCEKCGSHDELEIDHIDRTKKWSHRLWSYSHKIIIEELEKCQILCRMCHILKSVAELGYYYKKHGTRSMYRAHKCRCVKCKAWNAAYKRLYRARKLLLHKSNARAL